MNQINRNNRNSCNHCSDALANTLPPDATEAALSLILPPAAFGVLQAYLRMARVGYHAPEMPMREALELMDDEGGFEELELVASCYGEFAKQRQKDPMTPWPSV